MKPAFLMVAVAVFALPAAAQGAGKITPDCANPATQAGMNICAGRDYKAADTALNAAYSALRKKLGTHGRDLLKDSERKWIGWRDAECTFRTSDSEGGSIHPLVVSTCLTELTKARTAQLKKLTRCAEGDMSCPAN